MAGSGNANMQQFEIYFQRADLDRDGRISGVEAVSFLQGSNLSKQVLAQIWSHADQNHTGYLSRPEFYNALKLVTVAQSKRELTPDIVKAALYGPASAKIPAPQINLATMPASQQRPATAASSPQITASALPSVQNFGFRGPGPSNMTANQQFGPAPAPSVMRPNQIQSSSTVPNQLFGLPQSITATNWQAGQVQPTSLGMNQQLGQASPVTTVNSQFISAQGNQSVRPPVSMPTTAALRPSMGAGSPSIPGGGTSVGPNLPSSNTDWFSGKGNLVSSGIMAQGPNKDIPPVMPMASNPLDQFSTISPAVAKDPKASGASGLTSTSDSMFGGDIFSANRPSSPHVSSAQQQHMTVISSATGSPTSGPLPSTKPDPFQALQSTIMKPSSAVHASQAPMPKPNQATTQATSLSSPGISVGVGSSASDQSQFSWPKMARASIQKYGKVFMEVDTDRDGKITGDQARNLFLSWRLPREVLKQVWDLSDQDGDSMLSLREFCIALYLMERYREGRPLPSSLPNSVMLDETLMSLAGPPINYGSMVGGPAGLRPQGLAGVQPVVPSGVRPPLRPFAQHDGSGQLNQQNTRAPMTHNVHAKLSNGEDNSMNNTILDAAETDEKVENNEKVLLDSKEKLEFYRSKMQELVLYKSRCDNRLNEITERARADKTEAELLEKKYQEKYKEVAEIHSKLTIEEASFREIQERKMELQQAIIKIEQGGSADGILQVRADRIQSDLEELLKALNDRCKKHNLEIKSAAVIELPPGWMPGIPEVAAIWDEDWDKFEDEGLSFDVAVPVNTKSSSEQRENSSPAPIYPDSPSNAESASEKPLSTLTSAFDSESAYSADESKSMQGSPRGQTGHDSPSEEYSDKSASKSFDGDSEAQRRSFDEPSWGNFDTNDDVDSVWGFNAKDGDHGKSGDNYFFGSSDFGASPRGTDSPQAGSSFKNSPFRFEDSVPGSPLSKAGTSPPRYSVESRDPFFDSFSRYDSFSTHDRGSPPRRENISRFDSISSTSGFDHSKKFSFDDSDPFGSSGPFKVSESPKKASEWSSF